MQLDIFADSRDVMLRNDVVDALLRFDAPAARTACERLAQECPGDAALASFTALLSRLPVGETRPLADHGLLAEARQALASIETTAATTFGPAAAARWMARLQGQLAERARHLPFRNDGSSEHAAPLWLAVGDWSAAAGAVESIESWRRIPAPLAWMTEARLHLLGLQASWPLLAELGWLAPARLDDLLRRSPDALLAMLARRFSTQFEGDGDTGDAAWFVAWVLTERPEMVDALAAAAQPSRHTAPELAFRTLVELLGLERQGRQRDIVERRRKLRDLHPSLYAAYLRGR